MNRIQIPTRERTADTAGTKLGEQDRKDLFALTQMPGYRTLLRLMEVQCVLQDVELAKADPADERRVLAEHRKTQAMWEFFTGVQGRVEYEINELYPQEEEATQDADFISATVNP